MPVSDEYSEWTTALINGGMEMTQTDRTRYVVRVPKGISIKAALEEHRDRTGHGGCVFFVFDRTARRQPSKSMRAA
jgi:hypothetical protein